MNFNKITHVLLRLEFIIFVLRNCKRSARITQVQLCIIREKNKIKLQILMKEFNFFIVSPNNVVKLLIALF